MAADPTTSVRPSVTPAVPTSAAPGRITAISPDRSLGVANGCVTIDADDNLYWADASRVYRSSPSGTSTVFAGTGPSRRTGVATNEDLAARFYYPGGIAFDSHRNAYLTDSWNHVVLKLAPDRTISLFAGRWQGRDTGSYSASDDGGLATAARLNRPRDVAVGRGDVVYVADTDNNRIRRVDTNGTISTVPLIDGGDLGDAGVTLKGPRNIAMDPTGVVLFVSDTGNHRVLKLNTTTGVLSRVAGGSGNGDSGDGGPAASAKLNGPRGIAVDRRGNLFIADCGNHRVRQVVTTATGTTITTIAGTGRPTDPTTGDRSSATDVALVQPTGVACDSSGTLYITTFAGGTVRRVDRPTFSVPAHREYSFGTAAFSILAVVSPGLVSGTGPNATLVGNVVANREPYRKGSGGWSLSIVLDPPGLAAGRYVDFSTENGDGARQHSHFGLVDGAIAGDVEGTRVPTSSAESGYVHTLVLTRAGSGTVRMYLDGVEMQPAGPRVGSTHDLSNSGPLDMDRYRPLVPDEATISAPATAPGLVRKVCLWAAELSARDVVNVSRLVMNSRINARTTLADAAWTYTPPSEEEKGYTVRLTGKLTLSPHRGNPVSVTVDETGELAETLGGMKLATAWEVDPAATEADLSAYSFDKLTDVERGTARLTATGPGKTGTKSKDFPYADVRDDKHVHWDTYLIGGKKAGDRLDMDPGTADYTWNWDDGWGVAASGFSRDVDLTALPDTKCVGAWHLRGRAPGNARLGRDVSPVGNHLPAHQVLDAADLNVVLPFAIRMQKGDNWCWAATSLSVATFYDRTRSSMTQGQLVGTTAGGVVWSLTEDGPARPSGSGDAVPEERGGIYDRQNQVDLALNSLDVYAGGVPRPDLKRARAEIREGRPVLMRIAWGGPNGDGHFVVLVGAYNATAGGTEEPTIVVSDPINGVSTLPANSIVAGGATPAPFAGGKAVWTHTLFTRPVWASEK